MRQKCDNSRIHGRSINHMAAQNALIAVYFFAIKGTKIYPLNDFNQRARDSSSLERTKRTINRWDKRFAVFFVLYRLFGLVPVIFSKILEVRGTKMKKIHEELWAERRREVPPRQERSPRRHGAGPLQDEPAAGARVKTSVERRRPTAFRDGGRSVFLFKTGKYWNGKGRNIPYK